MSYLEDYGINEIQIKELESLLEDANLFIYEPEKICSILDLFKSIGVTNMYNLILVGESMFSDTVSSIKSRIDNYDNNEELASLINEDAHNLIVADLI